MSRWPVVALKDAAEIVSGGTPKSEIEEYWDGDIPWVTPKDLSDLDGPFISTTPRSITELGLKNSSATLLPANSVLFSSRAPIGHVAINAIAMATNQGFKSLVPKPDVSHAGYLYHWLRANRAYLEGLGNGATFKEVSKAVVAKVEIPLPPIDEQRRIAAILDHADALRAKRREALARLDELTQSIFIDMFGDPATNPKNLEFVTIGDLLESAQYGTSEKSGADGRFAVLRMNNITYQGQMDLADLKYTDLPDEKVDRFTVRAGDVLFNRTNSPELVGKTAVYRGERPMAFAGYLVRLRVSDGNSPEYISAFLNSRYGKSVLRGMCKSIVGMANINAREVQSIRIPKASPSAQREFEQRVALVESSKTGHRNALAELDALFASLQSRAFRGEL